MSRCPSGHESTADDYCDVCGLPIEAGGGSPLTGVDATPEAAPPATGTAADAAGDTAKAPDTTSCPNCQAANPPNALFCEACGYDFTTGQAPRQVSSLDLGTPPATSSGPGAADQGGGADPTPTSETGRPAGTPGDLAPPLSGSWVAEVWIDPDWYAEQDSSDPLPSAGVPTVVQLRSASVLVGRTSRSRGIHPDIDLTTDNGISRRHCQLTSDGKRWWVEDLGSSNGTYVGGSVGPLPETPIKPGEKREIAGDERVYLGAWTRIVLRKAAPGEL
ncbi:MAG TPA: FHA domain-containing protein [Nocardioides sp.]|nr:FHA domain-containing protein [Nocardioides sp.]